MPKTGDAKKGENTIAVYSPAFSALLSDIHDFNPLLNNMYMKLGGKRPHTTAAEVYQEEGASPPPKRSLAKDLDSDGCPDDPDHHCCAPVQVSHEELLQSSQSSDELATPIMPEQPPKKPLPPKAQPSKRKTKASKKEKATILAAGVPSDDAISDDGESTGPGEGLPVGFYTISAAMMNYLTGDTLKEPASAAKEFERWYKDQWDHLVTPPTGLTAAHYFYCIPASAPNSTAYRLCQIAANNLAICRFRIQVRKGRKTSGSKPPVLKLPYPHYQEDENSGASTQQLAKATSAIEKVSDNLITALKVLEIDINRQAAVSRGILTDSAQAIKATTLNAVQDMEELTKAMKGSTTPIMSLTTPESTPGEQYMHARVTNPPQPQEKIQRIVRVKPAIPNYRQ
ncbi:MAG: hypothetical protein [Bat faecal associated arto-like virus 2]|nr:MAG: hypothetical protein [Bat faecal associated arto-like virus 2]